MEQAGTKPSLFANRDFKLLFGGSTLSALGDQFTLVALPWLVLKLTGDAAALGLVLAAMALPRALFMLIGGAVVDRMSPRRVLLGSRTVNAMLIAILAALVLTGLIHMWMVYLLALGIGLSTAFAYPAGSAILPQLLDRSQLHSANALFMGMRQLSMFVGPALAGMVIALGSHKIGTHTIADASGMGLAFTIDAVSFFFSLASLAMIRIHSDYHPPEVKGGVFASVAGGVRTIWSDVSLRAFIIYAAVVSVFVGGPVQVGLPVLADTRLDWGAASLGVLMTANGGGILLGSVLSGIGTRFARGRIGLMVLTIDTCVGLAILGLTAVHSTLTGAALLGAVGLLSGIVQIAVVTWVQRRVAQDMMGRTMSVLLFVFMGLGPLSAAAAGGLLKIISLTTLFGGAGIILCAFALSCLAIPQMRAIGHNDAAAPTRT